MIRRNALRAVYGLGLLGYTAYGYWYMTSYMPAFERISGMSLANDFGPVFWVFSIPAYLIVAAPLAVLAVRPMWWGKIMMLLFLAGGPMAWAVSTLMSKMEPSLAPQVETASYFAYTFAGLAIVQQAIDPTVWQPPSTWLSRDCPPPWPFGRKPGRR
jgi:hypothetical protein